MARLGSNQSHLAVVLGGAAPTAYASALPLLLDELGRVQRAAPCRLRRDLVAAANAAG
jgi:hypothetical protein